MHACQWHHPNIFGMRPSRLLRDAPCSTRPKTAKRQPAATTSTSRCHAAVHMLPLTPQQRSRMCISLHACDIGWFADTDLDGVLSWFIFALFYSQTEEHKRELLRRHPFADEPAPVDVFVFWSHCLSRDLRLRYAGSSPCVLIRWPWRGRRWRRLRRGSGQRADEILQRAARWRSMRRLWSLSLRRRR